MAINIQHQVPVSTAGQIAYGAGLGEFQKEADAFYEGQRQFDEQMAIKQQQMQQQENQFTRNMGYQRDLAMLRDDQLNRKLGQNDYQYDMGLQSREADRALRYQMGDERNQLLGQEMEQRGQLSMNREQRGDMRRMQTQMSQTGMAAAANIEKTQFRNKEQKQQAIDQWVEQFGQYFNDQYPMQSTMDSHKNSLDYGAAVQQFTEGFGSEELGKRFASMVFGPGENDEPELLVPPEDLPRYKMDFQKIQDAVKFQSDREDTARLKTKADYQIKQQDTQAGYRNDFYDMQMEAQEKVNDLFRDQQNDIQKERVRLDTMKTTVAGETRQLTVEEKAARMETFEARMQKEYDGYLQSLNSRYGSPLARLKARARLGTQ